MPDRDPDPGDDVDIPDVYVVEDNADLRPGVTFSCQVALYSDPQPLCFPTKTVFMCISCCVHKLTLQLCLGCPISKLRVSDLLPAALFTDHGAGG